MTVATLNTVFAWIAILSTFLAFTSSIGTYWTGKILERPKVEIRPIEINRENSNPEIGHDSEYELEIIAPNPIAQFLLKVKIPESVWRPEEPFTLYNDTVTGDRAWYPYELEDGYANFTISNAAGRYRLNFGNIEPEQLFIDDIKW